MAATAADVLVVGAGGSGAPLAARLSADPTVRVLLLEAGSAGSLAQPLLDAESLAASVDPRTSWSYLTELAPGHDWHVARGRALGGSTAVNAGYFVRARAADLAAWERAGGPTWSADRVRAAYRRAERDLDVASGALDDPQGVHGTAGPVPVRRGSVQAGVPKAFVAAALAAGVPWEADKNADQPAGVGPLPRDVVDGVRWGTGLSYLLPAARRANLRVRGDARVLRVLLETTPAGSVRATGVEALVDGRVERVLAGTVVLCAGAIESAHLLLVSGIGPAADLEALGIPVRADLPVGRATSDHPQVAVAWHPDDLPAQPVARGPDPGTGAERTPDRGAGDDHGPGAHGAADARHGPAVAAVLHLDPATAPPGLTVAGEVELLPLLRPTSTLLGSPVPPTVPDSSSVPDAPLDLLVLDQVPESRGTLTLASADPLTAPVLRAGYLATTRDRQVLRDGVRAAARLVTSGIGTLTDPGLATMDDDRLDGWVRDHLGTAFHLCGSAPVGPEDDPFAVVDPRGRVHGVAGLRVVDLSILPTVPSRGPAATAVMLGELLADAVLG